MEKKSSCYPGKLMLCDFWKHLECSQNGVICVYWELHQVRGGVMGSQGTKFKVSLMVFLLLISKQLSSVSSGVFLVFLGCRLVYPAGRNRSRKQWKHCWFLQSSGEVSNEKVVLFYFFFCIGSQKGMYGTPVFGYCWACHYDGICLQPFFLERGWALPAVRSWEYFVFP